YQLQLMDAWRDRNYVLIRDIDASATDATLAGFDAAGIWSAQGFVPVGHTDQAHSFQGSFDGRGHAIAGLTIDRPGEDYAGLFGRTYDATIANVGLEGGSIAGDSAVGGLVGYQWGGSIAQSYATGAGEGRDEVGGLVGVQRGSIAQSQPPGAVEGSNFVGGLVGYQWDGSITGSFWDRNTTQQYEAVGNIGSASGATGLATAQMQDPFTFIDAGWDFAAIWGKSSLNENGGYMMLRGVGPGTLYDDYVRVAAVDLSRVYGGSNPDLAPHVTIDGVGAANVSVGWGSAVGSQANAGTYAFSDPDVLDISTVSAGGVYVDHGSGSLTVTPRAITVTADDLSRLYGEANPALTFGAIGGDGLAAVHADLAPAGVGLATAPGLQSDVGRYASDLTGANGNYDGTFPPGTLP